MPGRLFKGTAVRAGKHLLEVWIAPCRCSSHCMRLADVDLLALLPLLRQQGSCSVRHAKSPTASHENCIWWSLGR